VLPDDADHRLLGLGLSLLDVGEQARKVRILVGALAAGLEPTDARRAVNAGGLECGAAAAPLLDRLDDARVNVRVISARRFRRADICSERYRARPFLLCRSGRGPRTASSMFARRIHRVWHVAQCVASQAAARAIRPS
jgi:hypothetical protein